MDRDMARTVDFRFRRDPWHDPPKPRYIRKMLRHLAPWLQHNTSDERTARLQPEHSPASSVMTCMFEYGPAAAPNCTFGFTAQFRLRLVESACREASDSFFSLFQGGVYQSPETNLPRNMFQ
jgi:hypothetical protein